MTRTLLRSAAASLRVARAAEWLAARAPAEEVLVVAASADAASDLVRGAALRSEAAFGWHRATLGRLAYALAEPALVEAGLVPVPALGVEAVAARLLFRLRGEGALGRFEGVAGGPGLARALSRTLAELRLAGLAPDAVAAVSDEVGRLQAAYERELSEAGLADRATVLCLAAAAARDTGRAHPLLGLPTLLLDLPLESGLEADLVSAVVARAPECVATVPAGDETSCAHLEAALGAKPENLAPAGAEDCALARLQLHLFEEAAPAPRPPDASVEVLSAPGESRECVELARRIVQAAREETPFDRIAILLRSVEEYRPHLEEALDRAGVPAHFARGAVRPDPAGRAFLALLECRHEGLSARRFAEYLSLGEVPEAGAEGEPPPPAPAGERWVAPDEEMAPGAVSEALGAARDADALEAPRARAAGAEATLAAGGLRAPRRWERLLVDAAVIGGRERWERRLAGLARELELDLAGLDEPDSPRADAIRRDLEDLRCLRAFALPLLDALAALPAEAPWGAWLEALSALASRSLRRPERVQAALAELAPMAAVGPVGLEEVVLVLSRRLLEVALPPPAARYGRVFVAPAEAARGLEFDLVLVPGLAEKLFPRSVGEEPILLDAARSQLRAGLQPGLQAGLVTNPERIARERRALRLAAGAASRRLVLSYPRLDLDQARPRVPSFYALEALRAAEGRLPGFDELARRAERVTEARVGWPAPGNPAQAIDEAEHDLALLDRLLRLDEGEGVGTARYLLTANPHLGRALRFRARRWLRRWTPADGLVEPDPAAREALRAHALDARSYSPTALQHFASCPYRFFLYAVHRLAPREMPEALEELDPLQRGALVHDVQFALLARLREAGLLPVTPANLDRARGLLDATLDEVACRHRDELFPAIERVWEDGIAGVRADLREWLRRTSLDDSGFVPWRFELAFGLAERRECDPASVDEPVALDCGLLLRGSIDLVERRADGALRVTDHKTGRVRFEPGEVVRGGEALQPVLYALAAEKLFPGARVESGRLSYCTAAGGFTEREVPLDGAARAAAARVAEVVGGALEAGFLPAAPAPRACEYCDYRGVCGPYEELRTARKPRPELAPLESLRELR
jgi:CRISPR/Cas system-associated exonuclease Cas4 (RecB family)